MIKYVKKAIKIFCFSTEYLGRKSKSTVLSKFKIGRFIVDVLLWPSDLLKICSSHYDRFKFYPNLIKPRRFNEHLQQMKLFKRKQKYVQFADKIEVRKYVESVIGRKYLTNILWVGADIREARCLDWSCPFIIKSNHSSGTNLIVRDVNTFDWNKAYKLTQDWLHQDLSSYHGEWQYRWIKPKLFIEELLVDETGKIPIDYKFFCFNGRVEVVQIDFDRFNKHTRSFYDRNFELLPFCLEYPMGLEKARKPQCFEEMIDLVERLAGNETFVRIDLYNIISRPIFGEITLHPEAGRGIFDPDEWDLWMGALMRGIRLDHPVRRYKTSATTANTSN